MVILGDQLLLLYSTVQINVVVVVVVVVMRSADWRARSSLAYCESCF